MLKCKGDTLENEIESEKCCMRKMQYFCLIEHLDEYIVSVAGFLVMSSTTEDLL